MSAMMFPSCDRKSLSASVAIIHILLMLPPDFLFLLPNLLQLNLKTLTQPHKIILDSHTVIQVHLKADNFFPEGSNLNCKLLLVSELATGFYLMEKLTKLII